jgi:DNA-binding NarL/FixJ family response regulator
MSATLHVLVAAGAAMILPCLSAVRIVGRTAAGGNSPPADGFDLLALPVAGVAGRDEAPENLVRLLQRVARGACGVGPVVLRRLTAPLADLPLAPRECQVLALLCVGWRNARIGGALDLQLQSVCNYVSRAFVRLDVHSRTEAVARYGARLCLTWDRHEIE